jgi:N-acetylmuramoyl-L-alanine amidase
MRWSKGFGFHPTPVPHPWPTASISRTGSWLNRRGKGGKRYSPVPHPFGHFCRKGGKPPQPRHSDSNQTGCPNHAACFAAWLGWPIAALFALLGLSTPVFAQAPSAPASPRFVVVLNPAHGGSDAGANLDGQPEKAFTLAISIRLRSLLQARGIAVVTTRESDVTVDPLRRSEIANHAAAQACLTLHASETGRGVHLYTSSLAPAQPVTFEPWKTAQAAWITRSVALEGTLNSALEHAGIAVTAGRTALAVTDSMACPAVAIEIAPGTQSGGASGQSVPGSLADPDYQAQVANALTAALVEWQAEGSKL